MCRILSSDIIALILIELDTVASIISDIEAPLGLLIISRMIDIFDCGLILVIFLTFFFCLYLLFA